MYKPKDGPLQNYNAILEVLITARSSVTSPTATVFAPTGFQP